MYQIDFNKPIHVYFCGIGGISMSGLAEILKSRDFAISGSDMKESEITEGLRDKGMTVYIGQRASNVGDNIDLFVYTAAIHEDNPEWIAATDKNIPKLSRAELLEMLIAETEENARLREELAQARSALADRRILLEKSGSIAETALRLNGIFEAADRAAQQYLQSVRSAFEENVEGK